MQTIRLTASGDVPPLHQGFQFDLEPGYTVLIGPNDAGKSTILQFIFRQIYADPPTDHPRGSICLILNDRLNIDQTTETGGYHLDQYNADLFGTMNSQNIPYHESLAGPIRSRLPKLLINHTDFIQQCIRLNEYLDLMTLPRLILRATQQVTFEDVQGYFHGSGLRSIFAILAALTDDTIKLLLIDEPEMSLEPRLQKNLRDLLYAASENKTIVVSTHSHLFLNRLNHHSNYIVTKQDGLVSTQQVSSEQGLYDIAFERLGGSLQDLFFPNNFLVVEGASDQHIVNRLIELKGFDRTSIKVVSASGVDRVRGMLTAISTALAPLVISDSPYAKRVVALIDRPRDPSSRQYKELRKVLGDRLFVLDAHSLEEYLPCDLYTRCARDRDGDLRDLAKFKDDPVRMSQLKRTIAEGIAEVIEAGDLPRLQIVVDAVDAAARASSEPAGRA